MEFKHEISFISKTLKGEPPEWKDEVIKKEATFKEFSRTDQTQRELCWLIMEIFHTEKEKTTIDKKIAAELADKFVEQMFIPSDIFTEENRKEMLCDNGAMIKFGLWLVHEKVLPFFLKLMTD